MNTEKCKPNIDFSEIDALIFDLGAVIIEIDFSLTIQAFADLSGLSLEEVSLRSEQFGFYEKYESGQVSDAEFRRLVRDALQIEHEDAIVDKAWNSLLLELPAARVDRLKELAEKYQLFLLSNTSNIHIIEVNKILSNGTQSVDLKELFDKVYYSYKVGMRKPAAEIYEHVLTDNKLNAERTVFIDDNEANIKGAKKVGIHTIHLVAPCTMLDSFADA